MFELCYCSLLKLIHNVPEPKSERSSRAHTNRRINNGRNTLRVRLYQKKGEKKAGTILAKSRNTLRVRLYQKRLWALPPCGDMVHCVAILCECDYIKRCFQYMSTKHKSSRRNTLRVRLYQKSLRSGAQEKALKSVAILCECDYIKRKHNQQWALQTNGRNTLRVRLYQKRYAPSWSGCLVCRNTLRVRLYQKSLSTHLLRHMDFASRNTLRVRLYQKGTSGNLCLARAPRAISKAYPKISDAKGQSGDFTDYAHLHLKENKQVIQDRRHIFMCDTG